MCCRSSKEMADGAVAGAGLVCRLAHPGPYRLPLPFPQPLLLKPFASARCGLLLEPPCSVCSAVRFTTISRSAGIVAPKISMNCCSPGAKLSMFVERRMCVQRMLQGSMKENIANMCMLCSSVVVSPTKLTWSFETGGPLRTQLGHPLFRLRPDTNMQLLHVSAHASRGTRFTTQLAMQGPVLVAVYVRQRNCHGGHGPGTLSWGVGSCGRTCQRSDHRELKQHRAGIGVDGAFGYVSVAPVASTCDAGKCIASPL